MYWISVSDIMNCRKFSIIGIMVLIFIFMYPFSSLVGSELLHVGKTGYSYSSIQTAVNEADSGDTVFVHRGAYNESLDLYKKINLVGEQGAVLDVNGTDDIISITADNCIVKGLIIRNCCNKSFSGLNIESDGNIIKDNVFENNAGWGLYLYHSKDNIIMNNTMINDSICIVGSRSDWNSYIIQNNTVNGRPVLFYKNRENVNIIDIDAGQIILANCSFCNVENNKIYGGDQGIILGYCRNSYLAGNNVSHARIGIRLQYSENNTVRNNVLEHNGYGLYITHSSYNQIFNNNISKNTLFGCWLCCNSKSNVIFRNNFSFNANSSYDILENSWSKNNAGNYWSDYNGNDINDDGIGDTPYFILPKYGSSKDSYPIIDYKKIKDDDIDESNGFTISIMLLSMITIFVIGKKLCDNRR